MSHVAEHCDTPKPGRRDRIGTLWACDCGQVWRVVWVASGSIEHGSFKGWERFPTVPFEAPSMALSTFPTEAS